MTDAWLVTAIPCEGLHMRWRTFCFMASILERSRFPRLPVQPPANSGPSDVSAVNECLVPRFDSNTNPGKSSRRIVACWNNVSTNIVFIWEIILLFDGFSFSEKGSITQQTSRVHPMSFCRCLYIEKYVKTLNCATSNFLWFSLISFGLFMISVVTQPLYHAIFCEVQILKSTDLRFKKCYHFYMNLFMESSVPKYFIVHFELFATPTK